MPLFVPKKKKRSSPGGVQCSCLPVRIDPGGGMDILEAYEGAERWSSTLEGFKEDSGSPEGGTTD